MIKQQLCANFLFDLNGKKGPNTVGKDIGFMSALYPTDTAVVLPVLKKKFAGTHKHYGAAALCAEAESSYRLPNLEEAMALYFNSNISGELANIWTSSVVDSTHAWMFGASHGTKYLVSRGSTWSVHCVER